MSVEGVLGGQVVSGRDLEWLMSDIGNKKDCGGRESTLGVLRLYFYYRVPKKERKGTMYKGRGDYGS